MPDNTTIIYSSAWLKDRIEALTRAANAPIPALLDDHRYGQHRSEKAALWDRIAKLSRGDDATIAEELAAEQKRTHKVALPSIDDAPGETIVPAERVALRFAVRAPIIT